MREYEFLNRRRRRRPVPKEYDGDFKETSSYTAQRERRLQYRRRVTMAEVGQHGFGDVIREARKKQDWLQAELSKKSGLPSPGIARIEGNSDVTTTTIAKVARALGLRLELRNGV